VAVVESVARGECPLSPGIAATLFRRDATLAREPIEDRLTARELDVLGLIEEGLSNIGTYFWIRLLEGSAAAPAYAGAEQAA
jgi:DNA-binding NarL/FixJ family response regulator